MLFFLAHFTKGNYQSTAYQPLLFRNLVSINIIKKKKTLSFGLLIAVVIRVTRRPLICMDRPVERRGAVVVSAPPPSHPRPRATEVHFQSVDHRFGRLKLGTILKDHSDQHCWSKPSEQCEFLALLLFLFFLNSDIL